ncbi:MAG: tetratricopeptide repeat protein [Cyanobacteria bacterium]|nr:tetratricopeptide repeat protein [Cyanobacteriota bacterium]
MGTLINATPTWFKVPMSSDFQSDRAAALQSMERARAEIGRGNLEAAEPLLRQAIRGLRPQDEAMGECADFLTEIYVNSLRFAEAMALNQQLIDQVSKLPGSHNDFIAASLERLAEVNLKLGQMEQARDLSEKARMFRAAQKTATGGGPPPPPPPSPVRKTADAPKSDWDAVSEVPKAPPRPNWDSVAGGPAPPPRPNWDAVNDSPATPEPRPWDENLSSVPPPRPASGPSWDEVSQTVPAWDETHQASLAPAAVSSPPSWDEVPEAAPPDSENTPGWDELSQTIPLDTTWDRVELAGNNNSDAGDDVSSSWDKLKTVQVNKPAATSGPIPPPPPPDLSSQTTVPTRPSQHVMRPSSNPASQFETTAPTVEKKLADEAGLMQFACIERDKVVDLAQVVIEDGELLREFNGVLTEMENKAQAQGVDPVDIEGVYYQLEGMMLDRTEDLSSSADITGLINSMLRQSMEAGALNHLFELVPEPIGGISASSLPVVDPFAETEIPQRPSAREIPQRPSREIPKRPSKEVPQRPSTRDFSIEPLDDMDLDWDDDELTSPTQPADEIFAHSEGIHVNPAQGAGFQSIYKHMSDSTTQETRPVDLSNQGALFSPPGGSGTLPAEEDDPRHRLTRSSDKITHSSAHIPLRTMHTEDVSEEEPEEKKSLFGVFKSKKKSESVNESDQEMEVANQRSTQIAAVTLIAIAVILLIGAGAYRLLPWGSSAAEVVKTLDSKFQSADKMKTFWLIDDTSCDIAVGPTQLRAECRLFLNDWRDMVDLCIGPLFYKHCWFYKTDDGIVDYEGDTLYLSDGSVTKIVEQVDKISRYATMYYLKKRRYPSKINLGEDPPDLTYENPFTAEDDLPTFQKVIIGKGEGEAEAKRSRKQFFENLRLGRFWANAPEPHPGQIRCAAISFYNPTGNSKAFVVQILGKNNKPLSGSTIGSNYFFALEDGTEVQLTSPKCPEPGLVIEFAQGRRLRLFPVAVWFFQQKPDDGMKTAVKVYPLVIFSVLSGVFIMFLFTVRRGLGRIVIFMLLMITLIPAITFATKLFQ